MKYILIALIVFSAAAYAQVNPKSKSNSEERFIPQLYDSIVGGNLRIYTGKKFSEPFSKKLLEGSLYYGDDDWTDGILGYQGQEYANVTMRYHTLLDKLIILKPQGYDGIEIPGVNIDYFTLHNTRFERLSLPQEGYYAILYKGDISIFAHHHTTWSEKIVDKNVVTELKARQKYYIRKNDTVTQVKSKNSVMKVLAEQKTELKKFLRQEKIIFSQSREFALRELGKEFDRLQNQK